MIKAQVLLSWENVDGGDEPVIALLKSSSVMDRTGQPNERIIPDPNLTLWELWTDDLTPYESDTGIHIVSSVTIDEEGEITDNQPKRIDLDEAEKLRLYFEKAGMEQTEIDMITVGVINDRDYEELGETLKVQLKQLPKKKTITRIK